jgi:hypothetical protein
LDGRCHRSTLLWKQGGWEAKRQVASSVCVVSRGADWMGYRRNSGGGMIGPHHL